MCGVEVDGLDHWECVEMILFSVHLNLGLRGARDVAHANRVLDQPLVDGLRRMRHEDAALEIRLREDIG